jgi:hypothetical protein
MPAFRIFDPYAFLGNEGQAAAPAKAAKPAKAGEGAHPATLATLAALAATRPEIEAPTKRDQAEEKWPAVIDPVPLLLPDGRRLHRFRVDAIPASVPRHAGALQDQARWYGAVLVADGHDLIVVERWQSGLPMETLRALKDAAGAIIACLRGESRARCTRQEAEAHNE